MHFKNVLLLNFISTHQPLHKCLAFSDSAGRKCVFLFKTKQTFPISTMYSKNFSLGRMHNENTPKNCYKNKIPLLGGKKLSYSSSRFTLCEGSGNYRKKWPQDVLYFVEWIIYVSIPESVPMRRSRRSSFEHCVQLFSQTSDSP